MRYRVRTVTPGVTEKIAGVAFFDGEALVDSGPALAYFRSAGYIIEPAEATEPVAELSDTTDAPDGDDTADSGEAHEVGTADTSPARPRRNASAADWRTYAITHGMPADEAETLGRDEIAARFPEENN